MRTVFYMKKGFFISLDFFLNNVEIVIEHLDSWATTDNNEYWIVIEHLDSWATTDNNEYWISRKTSNFDFSFNEGGGAELPWALWKTSQDSWYEEWPPSPAKPSPCLWLRHQAFAIMSPRPHFDLGLMYWFFSFYSLTNQKSKYITLQSNPIRIVF